MLENDLIKIRPYTINDVQAVYEAVMESRNELQPWMPWCHPEYSIEDTFSWVKLASQNYLDKKDFHFLIFEKSTQQLIGAVGIGEISRINLTGNLGYWIKTSATGKGIASQATILTAKYGFEELKLVRIEIMAAIGNTASQRVAAKVGAVREGVLRKRLRLWGTSHDAVLFSLLKEDLK